MVAYGIWPRMGGVQAMTWWCGGEGRRGREAVVSERERREGGDEGGLTLGQPATLAVRMVMWAEARSGYLPPGM